jgi:hypothetical protein
MLKERETMEQPEFREANIENTDAPGCVDGRKDSKIKKAVPKMLAGSVHPILTAAIYYGKEFNGEFVNDQATKLTDAGYKLGVHRGLLHKKPEQNISDCGFADNVEKIIKTAQERGGEIVTRLMNIYTENSSLIQVDQDEFKIGLDNALSKIKEFDLDKIKISGETLIALFEVEELNAQAMDLEHDHAEKRVFVNLKPGVTYDTNAAVDAGDTSFDLDVPVLIEQAGVLGGEMDREDLQQFAMYSGLILFVATEMVLVEDKNKPALPVYIHS